jgi:hypothetical protein
MRRFAWLLACLLLCCPPLRADEGPPEAERGVNVTRLMQHVRWLAAPERKGRGRWPDRAATADYIATAFAAAGLKPLPGRETMFQDKAGLKEPALRNVVAWLPGAKGAAGEHVILSAHHDHLGQQVVERKDGETVTRTTVTYAGADDNASGVAALLEIARELGTRHKTDPKAFPRAVVFVAFDLEERQVAGSRHYVAEPLLPLKDCAAFLTMDMLGRSVGDLAPGNLFVMGSESSAVLQGHLRAAGDPAEGRICEVGIDFQPGYSDYVPFEDAEIPYLFVTSGACEDYHQPGDVPARIEAAHLQRRAAWCLDLTMRIVGSAERPAWRDGVAPSVEEMRDVRALIATIEKNLAEVGGLPPMARQMVGNYGAYLDKVLADGDVTAAERTNARNGALNLFRMAQQMAAAMRR